MSMRDEDISFPPQTVEAKPLKGILIGLNESLEKLKLRDDEASVALSGHLMLMKALLLLTMNVLSKEKLVKETAEEEEGKEVEKKKKKKGKKEAAKGSDPRD